MFVLYICLFLNSSVLMHNWAVTKILAQELLYGTIYDPIYWELLQHMMGIIFKQSLFRVCMGLQRVFVDIRLGLPQDWPHKQIVRSWVVQIHVVNCCIWNHRALGLKTHARQELRLLESEVPMTLSKSLCCFRFHDLSSKNRLPCDHLASCTMNKLLSMADTVRDCLM